MHSEPAVSVHPPPLKIARQRNAHFAMSYPPAEHRQQPDNGDRPTTARPPSSAGADYYYEHHDPQYTYSEEPLDEDDESEDEDVFAYLPPTTAQVQEQHQNEHDQQQFAFTVGQTPDDEWHVCAPRPY